MTSLRLRVARAMPSLTTVLDVFGTLLVAGFAYFCWPPAALLVVGVACLASSYAAQRASRPEEPSR